MNWTALTDENQWKALHERSLTKDVLIFKHSTRCSISAAAEEEMIRFTTEAIAHGLPLEIAQVLVVEHRPTSLQLADDLQVVHKSPQVILIRGGKAVWDTSHWSITAQTILDNVKKS